MPTNKRTIGKRKVTTSKETSSKNRGGVETYRATKKRTVSSPKKTKKTTSVFGSSYRDGSGIYKTTNVAGSSKTVKTPRKKVSRSNYSKGVDGDYSTVTRYTDRKGKASSYSNSYESRNALTVNKKTKETKNKIKSKGFKGRTSYNWTPSGGGANTGSSASYKYKKNKKTGNSKLVQKSSGYMGDKSTSSKKVYKNGKLVRSRVKK